MHIYKWTHKDSGKAYIGQSIQEPNQRVYEHKRHGHYFHHALKKYGEDAFDYEILCWVESLDDLNDLEEKLIKEHNTLSPNGYNLRAGGGNRGRHHPDSIEKMRRIHTELHASGKKRYGWKRKDGGNMLGKTQSQKQKDMMKEPAKIQVVCPHCGLRGQRAAMGRWHFDNCKENAK